jgi:hypothetical protein
VQLTVAGDEAWFTANEATFADFIKVLRLSVAKSPAGQ